MSTSTPNDYILGLCKKYNLELTVNEHPGKAGDDWNHAYDTAGSEIVTLAHQDDIYDPRFAELTIYYLNRRRQSDAIMTFTDYYEIRNGRRVSANRILNIKRVMNKAFRAPGGAKSRFVRHRILSVGDSICCPSASFVKKNAGESIFDTHYINSCDYKTWVDLSNKRGAFVYIPDILMGHRIYEESATTHNLEEGIRKREDAEIMALFWPKPIARIINHEYAKSEKSNEL